MFKNYFKTGFRNLVKYKSFSLINLIGLTLGLASIMVLAVLVYQYLTANGQFQHKDRLFYVKTRDAGGREYKNTPYPFLAEALKSCPDIETGTHIQSWYRPWLKNGEKEFQDNTWFVDTGFFKVFSYPLAYGNPQTALKGKYNIILSSDMAGKLFGKENPVGKVITADDTLSLTVTGVLAPIPSNTTFRPEVLMTTALLEGNHDFMGSADWYNTFAENYLLLRPQADIAKINQQFNQIVQTFYNKDQQKNKLQLVPYSRYIELEAGNIVQVMVKGEIGTIIFILLVIIANLINLNVATLFNRSKEVAVRQMIGCNKRQIVLQFCIENAILIFTSLILAFGLFRFLLLPQINHMIGDRFGNIVVNMQHDYPLALVFVTIGLLIVTVAGSYPAFHLTSLKVTDAIKGKIGHTHKKHYTRNIFITLQFIMAITFIGITIILNRQIHHMKGAALGFDKENVLVVPLDLAYKNPQAASAQFDAILNQLHSNAYVKDISTSDVIPTAYPRNYNIYYDPVTNREVTIRHAAADAGLLSTYHIPVIQGRNFREVATGGEEKNIIINKAAMEALGWQNAVGKQLATRGNDEVYNVIGVMDDFHYADLTTNIEPLIHWYGGKDGLNYRYLSLRVDPGHANDIIHLLEKDFKTIPSRRTFRYEYMSDRISRQYTLLDGILKAMNYVALLTLFIAGMGLFGLIALFTQQRVKEIGIRKVLGASPRDIIGLLSRNYLLLVSLAALIASPIVWFVMSRWLQDFAYRIDIQAWMFVAAALTGLCIALLIVGYHAVRSATANPVNSLRSE